MGVKNSDWRVEEAAKVGAGSSKGANPGFSGHLPRWGFGSPGDLGSPQYRLTALHCTARPDLKRF